VQNDIRFHVYYGNDREPKLSVCIAASFIFRFRIACAFLFTGRYWLDAHLEDDEVRALFGQTGKVLRQMKKDRADG
jgi:hypothetical protein